MKVEETSKEIAIIKKVGEYYNRSQIWYNLFWSDRESLGMHFGFWETGTQRHREALINQYRCIKEILNPQASHVILDAGCGVGGASLWLAENTPAHYIGITLSLVQIRQAKKIAQTRHLTDRVSFELQNYFETNFSDESFDAVFCIESACYAYPHPANLYQELYRILKPGGILVISDGVLLHHPTTAKEKGTLSAWFDAWALSGGCTAEEIVRDLKTACFQDIQFIDKAHQIEPDVRKLGLLGRVFFWPLRIFSLTPFLKTGFQNAVAAKTQETAYDQGLFGYGIFSARKK